MLAPHGAHGPHGAPNPPRRGQSIFRKLPKIDILAFLGCETKVEIEGREPPGEIRAEILRGFPVPESQMVPRRPIWRQKGVIWGPLGFQAWLAWSEATHPGLPGC